MSHLRASAVLLATLALGGLVPLPVLAAGETPPEKRAFEIADIYASIKVESLDLSPDGTRAAFAVRHYDLEAGETWRQIWMMKADGSDQRRMTTGRHQDGSPQFSPDGKSLLFVSDREEGQQLWIVPVDGGEPRPLTSFSMGVSDPLWSPDGRYIAVTSKVFPECGADSACNEEIETTWREGKLNAHVADKLLYRHWTSWYDGRYAHVLLIDAKTGEAVRDLTPGAFETPTFSAQGGDGYAFSPDGKEICFVSNRDEDAASSTNADLWIAPVGLPEDGEAPPAVNITAANKGWDAGPVYSPDGRYIAYRSMATPGYEADLTTVALYDRSTGETRHLTGRGSFANQIRHLAWHADSQHLVFEAAEEGRTPLFQIEVAPPGPGRLGEVPRRVLVDATLDSWTLHPDGRSVIYIRRAIASPWEVHRATLSWKGGSTGRERLTTFNAALEGEVDIRPAEELWIKGDGDYKVHTFLIKPHDFDPSRKYPLILNVHGGPQGQWQDSYRGDWQVYPGKGYIVAFPNPTGSTGYGQDFTDAIGCDWGGRVFRDLMKVTDALEKLPFVDADRMGAMGWSYGGYMMMWFAGHTDRFKTLAAMMGLYDLPSFYGATEELWFPDRDLCGQPWNSEDYLRWSPSQFAINFNTPSLIITGELDYRVPYTQSLQYFTALQKQNIPSRLVVLPDAGHWPGWYEMAFYYLVHLDWFHQYLGGGEPPWSVEDFLRNREPAGKSPPS